MTLSWAGSRDRTLDAPLKSETIGQFLHLASQRANEYAAQPIDLTTRENKYIERFGNNGKPAGRGKAFSELVIYESGGSRQKSEFREVQESAEFSAAMISAIT